MTLPDKVQIGAISYSVKAVDDLHTTDADGKKKGLNGHILYDSATIKVDSALADDMQIAVIWHEVLHGLLDQAAMDEHPEQAIVVLGYGLVRLLRDNPALVQATIGCNDGRDGAE